KKSLSRVNMVFSNMIKKFFKILVGIAIFLLLLATLTLTTVDWSDYQEQDYYHKTIQAIDDMELEGGASGFLLAGWSTTNSTPAEPQDLVGYKPRGEYEFVQDSSYIKTLVI